MPICTMCTTFVPYLFTVYPSAYNTRLEHHGFADPYVEHDSLTLLIDLILLKRGVYRHLLYNRGSKPRRAMEGKKNSVDSAGEDYVIDDWERETRRWIQIVRLGLTLVFVDAFIRWSYLNSNHPPTVSPWSLQTIHMFAKVFLGCLAETIAFHGGVLLSCFVLRGLALAMKSSEPEGATSAIRNEFRFSLIPLSLFYSSLTKLFLLFLLAIWRPSKTPSSSNLQEIQPLPWMQEVLHLLGLLDDDKLDREWIVRNVLGGMSAGFGLRVILDYNALFITVIIIIGWASKTVVSSLVGHWIGVAEIWMAYSIP